MTQFLDYLSAHPWSLWLLAGALSLLLARRSQVDAWVEMHPKVGGLLKLLRGFGIDPWLIVQGLWLLVRGRLPDPPQPKPTSKLPPLTLVTLALVCLGLSGCAAWPSSQSSECSETSLGLIVADCKLKVDRECPPESDLEQCPAVQECDARVDAWEKCR